MNRKNVYSVILIIVSGLVIVSSAVSQVLILPDSGQSLCYDWERIMCDDWPMEGFNQVCDSLPYCPEEGEAFYGQDAIYSINMPDVVETSSNLAIIKSENGTIEIAILTRSAVDADRDIAATKIADVFKENGATTAHFGAYPGWKPDVDSPILKAMKEVYNNKYGKVPAVKVIHAGLECGILGAIYPNWDMISFGPTIRFPHSPDEKVKIDTVGLYWDFLIETLKNAPKK